MAPRLLERLKALAGRAWSHRHIIVWIFIIAAYSAFAALPMFAQRGYMDEKALIVGAMGLSIAEVSRSAVTVAQALTKPPLNNDNLPSLVSRAAIASVSYDIDNNISASPLLRWHNTTFLNGCHAVHAVVPGGRGDGTESLLLVLPIDHSDKDTAALAVAVGVMAARHLSSVAWLAKDLAILFMDSSVTRCSTTTTTTLQNWLERMDVSGADDRPSVHSVPPLGLLQQGLIVDIRTAAATEARIGVNGYNGQLPNLDMVVLTKRNLDYFTNLPSGIGLDIGGAPATKHPKNAPFMQKIRTAAVFASYIAAGQPTGAHGALLHRGVDALTVTLTRADLVGQASSGDISSSKQGSKVLPSATEAEALSTARNALVAAEMILRTCNNLHERLHHANALYLLTDADHFVNVGAYMAPPGLLLAALVLQTAGASVNLGNALGGKGDASRDARKKGWALAIAVHSGIVIAIRVWSCYKGGCCLSNVAGPAWSILAISVSLWKIGNPWGEILLFSGRERKNLGSEKEVEAGNGSGGMRSSFVAACSVLFVVGGAALLLWRWALCFVVLAIAVPLLQLLST